MTDDTTRRLVSEHNQRRVAQAAADVLADELERAQARIAALEEAARDLDAALAAYTVADDGKPTHYAWLEVARKRLAMSAALTPPA